MKIERILVRGTNWIGDAVMSTPALRRLRSSFPGARISLLATPLTCELLASSDLIDEVIPYRRREKGSQAILGAVSELKERHFDLAILFQNAFEAALLARLASIPLRVGFAAQGRGPLLSHRLRRGPDHRNRHQINDYLDIVAACENLFIGHGFEPVDPSPLPHLVASPAGIAGAKELLESNGIRPGTKRLVALNVGATNSRAKCWPPEHYATLAGRLSRGSNAKIVLTGGPGEMEAAAAVASEAGLLGIGGEVINLAGKTDLQELLGLLSLCALIVSNDTGPAHIAAALGRPVLTLFGPTNEFETAPTGPHASLIRAEGIECARCMYRDCPIDHKCMTRLTVEEVCAGGERIIDEPSQ